jgi:hypothetical protein
MPRLFNLFVSRVKSLWRTFPSEVGSRLVARGTGHTDFNINFTVSADSRCKCCRVASDCSSIRANRYVANECCVAVVGTQCEGEVCAA